VVAVTEHLADPVAVRADGHERRLIVIVGVCLCAAAFSVVALQFRHGPRSLDRRPVGPVVLSAAQLERFAAGAGRPIYWAGPRSGYVYELTRTRSGRVYVRYLPQGFVAGDTRPDFLTVATYPTSGAYENLRRAGTTDGASGTAIDGGGIAVSLWHSATNVYLAYAHTDYQVEVFNPVPGHSRKLLLNGAIVPIR
jgi:hypothetical protein